VKACLRDLSSVIQILRIASVYTEMNAVSKGVSIGVYSPNKGKASQKSVDGAQPYVNLMDRRIPLYRSHISHDRSQWRALSSGKAVPPLDAYKYITTSMKQTTPYIVGAMRLLADSYDPEELNRIGFSLYCDFRPDVEPGTSGWGKRGKVPCEAMKTRSQFLPSTTLSGPKVICKVKNLSRRNHALTTRVNWTRTNCSVANTRA